MRSDVTKVGAKRAPHRALLKGMGLTDDEIAIVEGGESGGSSRGSAGGDR